MFSVVFPPAWSSGRSGLVVRLIDKTTRNVVVRSIVPGRRLKLGVDDLPGSRVDDVLAWIDAAEDGQRVPLTPRVHLGRLKHIRQLGTFLAGPADAAKDTEEAERIAMCVNAWRWIQLDSQKSVATRLAQDLTAPMGSQPERYAARLGLMMEEMAGGGPVDDGSPIMNQLIYLHGIIGLGRLYRKHPAGLEDLSRLTRRDPTDAEAARDGLRVLRDELMSFGATSAAIALVAVIDSLVDGRDAAARRFGQAQEAGRDALLDIAPFSGAFNYGPLPDAEAPRVAQPIARRLGDLAFAEPRKNPTVLYSANPAFLRSYLPRVLFYASLFPEYRYHFHLVGEAAECEALAGEANKLYEQILSVRGVTTSRHQLEWSTSLAPDSVPRPVSYFASARFMIAEQIMDITGGPIWIQDVDLFPTGDTTLQLPRLLAHDVSLFFSRQLGGAIPWMRFLAGNVFVSPTVQGVGFLRATTGYLRYWLGVETSWMVDQNALAYALETVDLGAKLGDVQQFDVPLRQSFLPNRIETAN